MGDLGNLASLKWKRIIEVTGGLRFVGLAARLCEARGALPVGMGGLDYAACETGFEAKPHETSVTGVQDRWDLFDTGGRHIRRKR